MRPVIAGRNVIVIGGGLAGLAAAVSLGEAGYDVTILEARGRLGGRASSFQDVASGQLIDTCQHVSMGCCTNLAYFFRTIGVDHLIERQRLLRFMTPDGRVSIFRSEPWPAPFHLSASFLRAHFLTAVEKMRIAWGLAALLRAPAEDEDPPFSDWLAAHHQTPRTIGRFWGLVLTSALNEEPARVGLRYARKVFVDGFMRDRRGFDVEVPTVPLATLYGKELQGYLDMREIRLRLQEGGRLIRVEGKRASGVELRSGEILPADVVVSAVPFDRLLALLPDHVIESYPCFANLRRLETSPITSVHVWYDRPVMSVPQLVLIDCVGQWVFNRGQTAPGEHYLQVVVSAARQFRGWGNDEIQRRITSELSQLLLEAGKAKIVRARVVTEHDATFSAVPGVDRWRPTQTTPIENLYLAGDWTQTGWPATMEGAVLSGYLAAEAICRRRGMNVAFVQPALE
jgi:squalene-associated FAD-dependent desaturase